MLDDLIRQVNRLQQQVDGLVKPEVGRWVDWTPTVTQGVSVTVTVIYSAYFVLNRLVIVNARLNITSNGTVGSPIQIGGQPTIITPTAIAAENVIGIGMVLDNGTARYSGPLIAAVGGWIMQPHNTAGSGIGNVPSFGLTTTDVVSFAATYQSA